MTTAWSHLPNAKYIDRVLASLKSDIDKWAAIYDAYIAEANQDCWAPAYDLALRIVSLHPPTGRAIGSALHVVAGSGKAYTPGAGVLLALIAWDDCAYMIESDVDELKILAALGDQRAFLLLPACIVFNGITVDTIA